jgi:hypothetical protein
MVCNGTHPQPVDSVGQSGVRRGREKAHVAVLVAVATPGAADVQVQQWADRQTAVHLDNTVAAHRVTYL